jgi:hypothetical protein
VECSITSGQEGQLGDLLGIPSWGCLLISLILAVVIGYFIFFLFWMNSKRTVNNRINDEFGKMKEVELTKNSDGIYDIKGTIQGRKFEIKHLNGVWSSPRKAIIKIQHRISGITENIKLSSIIITPKIFRENLTEWPERNLKKINKTIDGLSRFEKEPELLSDLDLESSKLLF